MRGQGVTISDPDPVTGGIQIGDGSTGRGGKLGTLNDPKFKEAQNACQSALPKGGAK
jgi:hypothetical protein